MNNKATRISIATVHGPSLDSLVRPAQELLEREGEAPAYNGIKYIEYLQVQQRGNLVGKSNFLNRIT